MAMKSPIRKRDPKKDITGERFGKLTVIGWAEHSRWLCQCDCGKTTKVITANLNRGNTSSCGCIRNALASKRNTIHGLHDTPAYKTWVSVKRRCYEKTNPSYRSYGARGIRMHAPWKDDPAAFVNYVGQPPSEDHTLDRIDNKNGYFPGNVRWASALEQGANKSNNRIVTFQGKQFTLAQLGRYVAEECGIKPKQFMRAFEKAIYKDTV